MAGSREVGRSLKVEMTLYSEKGIMKDANSWSGLISRYLRRSRTSFQKWFNNVPNLATGSETGVHYEIKSGVEKLEEPQLGYHGLLIKLRDEQDLGLPDEEKPRSVRHLQEAVDKIVCRGKEKMADAHSQEEIIMGFMADIYKIKSLL